MYINHTWTSNLGDCPLISKLRCQYMHKIQINTIQQTPNRSQFMLFWLLTTHTQQCAHFYGHESWYIFFEVTPSNSHCYWHATCHVFTYNQPCYVESPMHLTHRRWVKHICIRVRSWNCGCLVTWFCYQLIAKPGNKTATVPWPDP